MHKHTPNLEPRLDQQIDIRVVTVTPELAEEWLGRNHSNRNLRPRKIVEYSRDMTAGNWGLTGESIKFDETGRLIDGQHRLLACINSGKSFQTVVVRGLEPETQGLMDTGAKRSAADALKFAGLAGGSNAHAAIIRLAHLFTAGEPVRSGDIAASLTNSEVKSFYLSQPDLIDYCVLIAHRYRKQLNVSPAALGAAVYVAACDDKLDQFVNFVTATADLHFNGSRDPKAVLYKRLATLHAERHRPTEAIYFILRAFRAYLAGEEIGGMKSSVGGGRTIIPTTFKEVAK